MPSDARAQQARAHHEAASAALNDATTHRDARDDLIRRLRAEDPDTWTYPALAKAVGCSPELIASIIKGRVRRHM